MPALFFRKALLLTLDEPYYINGSLNSSHRSMLMRYQVEAKRSEYVFVILKYFLSLDSVLCRYLKLRYDLTHNLGN